jgi:ATP-dependent RNA helicase DeaD
MQLQQEEIKDIPKDNESRASGATERNMIRFFINVGRKDKVTAKDIVGCIAGEAKISGVNVGKVDIYEMFSFVEVEKQYKRKVLDGINHNNVMIRNRRISIEVAKGKR